jgi:hypothetical protein
MGNGQGIKVAVGLNEFDQASPTHLPDESIP